VNDLLVGFGDPDRLSNKPVKVLAICLNIQDEQSLRDVVSSAKEAVLDAV